MTINAPKKPTKTVDVIIPTYKPDDSFRDLLLRLRQQSYPIGQILIINTDEQYWKPSLIEGIEGIDVFQIRKDEFDHGRTRDMGAGFSNADILVYMTQDAVPCNRYLIENLVRPFSDKFVKASYARQLPKDNCAIPEALTRMFNYPEKSTVHQKEDLKQLGIKTYFCSNVCAAYDHHLYREMGGFNRPCIFNEDMLYAARIILLGYKVAYAAEAKVRHSHNYTWRQQFHRNFDNGVSQAMHPEIFSHIKSGGEGRKMVKYVTKELRVLGRGRLIPGFYMECAFRLLGFQMGKHYHHLPKGLVRKCTMNATFWNERIPENYEADV